MNTILICCDYFLPGYKAGGPITTLSNLVAAIRERCRVFVITSDRDYLDSMPYHGVDSNGWTDLGGYMVRYLDRKSISTRGLAEIVSKVDPDSIYLNSLFSYDFSIRLLLARRLYMMKEVRWVLCPRGELNEAALRKGVLKKQLFLTAGKLIRLHDKVTWQATNEHEFSRIRKVIGSNSNVFKVTNLSRFVDEDNIPRLRIKQVGNLSMVFVGRINSHKNLSLLLDAMVHLRGNIHLKIYGPVDDQLYWAKCCHKIASLSNNVRVDYSGVHGRDTVIEAMRWAHLLVLPSRSENFGHVIYEALSVGTPVIVSDKTPWRGLVEKGVGWDCDIKSSDAIVQALTEVILMDQTDWIAMIPRSKAYARETISHDQIIIDTMKLLVY
jgi:glycosyltransferase involved in cell wall biosynthesis